MLASHQQLIEALVCPSTRRMDCQWRLKADPSNMNVLEITIAQSLTEIASEWR
jgi:hypothetical protein